MSTTLDNIICNIIAGKIDAVKNEEEIREKIWQLLLEKCVYLSFNSMIGFFTEKEYYSCTEEEKTEAEKKLKGLSYTHSMLVALHNAVKDADIVDWKGGCKKEAGESLKHCYEILEPYGWTFANEDAEKVLDGTHELYEKEEG